VLILDLRSSERKQHGAIGFGGQLTLSFVKLDMVTKKMASNIYAGIDVLDQLQFSNLFSLKLMPL